MDKTQALWAAELLNIASDIFSNHTCNDLKMPNTEANRNLIKQMIEWNSDPDEEFDVDPDDEYIYETDWLLMSFLADKLEEYVNV